MVRAYKKICFLLTFSLCFFISSAAYATDVIPIGKTVGVKIFTDGLLVIGSSEVNGKNVAKEYGIHTNDRIKGINGNEIKDTETLVRLVNDNPEGVRLSVIRDNHDMEIDAVPVKGEDNVYRLGLWVRDSTAGIGTVTFYNPETKNFAALGHCINDVDTGNILSVKSGNILNCNILSVTKSEKGAPGEINGAFEGDKIGDVNINSQIGIFGKMTSAQFDDVNSAIPIAKRDEIQTGEAYILTDAFGENDNRYSINIKKITQSEDKALVIEITDSRLIDGAGGIVQGMSGSPIIQDGKLVGAVTHVFVNNPLKGYGTLAESMLEVQEKTSM